MLLRYAKKGLKVFHGLPSDSHLARVKRTADEVVAPAMLKVCKPGCATVENDKFWALL